MKEGERRKLGWIELARGLAALTVVISHAVLVGAPESLLGYLVPSGTFAVAFFFSLSGFIILFVHERDIGRPSRLAPYLWRRLIRIFPTYWLILIVDLVIHSHSTANPLQLNTSEIVQEFFFFPGKTPFIYVAWTLRHELLFYILFSVLMLNRRVGAALFGLWFVTIVYTLLQDGWANEWPPLNTITSSINLCFFIGLAAAAFGKGVLSSISASESRVSYWLGSISYPLYLCHPTIYFIMGGIFKRTGLDNLAWSIKLIIVTAASVGFAALISFFYEGPLLRRLRPIFSGKTLARVERKGNVG